MVFQIKKPKSPGGGPPGFALSPRIPGPPLAPLGGTGGAERRPGEAVGAEGLGKSESQKAAGRRRGKSLEDLSL